MYNTKGKTQKSYKKNKPNLNLVPKNCVVVFPIELVGGKTQVSNQGIMPGRKYYDKGSFLYWQEVFDGRSALKIQWQDSIKLEKPIGQNYYLAKPSIGKYYYGKPISNGNEALEISEDASYEDFISMKASQTITLRFEYDPTNRNESWLELQEKFRFTLVDNDLYNLYLIPEICEEKLMYIQDYQEYYDDLTGKSKGCEITFASLGDKIQKSGQAIEQYCSWSAPGEFAVKPVVVEVGGYGTTDWQRYVAVDYNALYNPLPIQYLQVEQQGPALTSTIYALGRQQEWDEENECWKIGPSKLLFPYNFITTQPNPLNRTSTPTKNYFCFYDEQVTMVTSADVMKWWQEASSQPLEQVKNNGMISIGANDDWSTSYNHKSNLFNETTNLRKDYYDKTWFPLGFLTDGTGGTEDKQPEFDTKGCIYATDTIKLLKTDNMIDIMVKNAFIFNQQPIIPLSYYSTRPFYVRDIPLIGSIANFFKIGDIKLANNTTSRKASSLCFFGDADIMSMCADLNGSMGTPFKVGSHVFPINFFGTNMSQYQKLGVNSANTTFCFSLTDKVSIDGTVWDTIYLGQSTYEDGTELFPETHQSLLANSTIKPATPTSSNFIIDAVVVQSIFDGKIKISCYTPDESNFIYPQWTATILSNAAWQNGNMRDWTNIFLLSNWEERFCRQEDQFIWPLGPHKKESEDFVISISAESNFDYTNNDQAISWQQTSNLWQNSRKQTAPSGQALWVVDTNSEHNTMFNSTTTYSDMGITGVTDKDTFIQHFGNGILNYEGTFLSLDSKQVTPTTPQLTFNLETGKYDYVYYAYAGAIRNTSGKQIEVGENDFRVRQKEQSPSTLEQGTFLQRIRIELKLNDTDFQVNVKNESYSGISATEEGQYIGDNKPIYSCRVERTVVQPEKPQKIQSYIKVNSLTLQKRS